MEVNNSENMNITDENELDTSYLFISNDIRFILLLILTIPSIAIYILVFYFIVFDKTLRSAANNFIIIIILFHSFVIVCFDIPLDIDRYAPYPIVIWSNRFCHIWWYIDCVCFYTMYLLIAWASFERHILIFQPNCFNIKWKKICFHYLPPAVIIIYTNVFYIYAIFVYQCDLIANSESNTCYDICYFYDPILNLWETSFHAMFPTVCIVIFNCALLIRVYLSKTRLRQSINWRKYRLMIFQLVSIAFIYILVNVPYFIIILLLYVAWSPWIESLANFVDYISSIIPLLFSFVCLVSIPDVKLKLTRFVNPRAQQNTFHIFTRTVHPKTSLPQ